MKKLVIAIAVMMGVVMVTPVITYADQFFVIRDKEGQTAVTDGSPGYGWIVQSGPYASIDMAERATGTGTGLITMLRKPFDFPEAVPRYRGQSPMAELTP